MSLIRAGKGYKPSLLPSAPAGPGPERGAAIAGTRLPPGGGSAGRPALPCGNTGGWIPRPGPARICLGTQVLHDSCPETEGRNRCRQPLPLTRRVGAALDTGNYW